MRTFLLGLALAATAVAVSAQTQRGDKSLGLRTGYISNNRSVTAGIEFQYAFGRHAVVAPSVDYVFRNDNLDGLLLNLDYHCPFTLSRSGRWSIYPLAGLSYASWSSHTRAVGNCGTSPTPGCDQWGDDVTTRYNHAGFNLGGGAECLITPTLKLSIQARYNFTAHYSTALVNVGISYVF